MNSLNQRKPLNAKHYVHRAASILTLAVLLHAWIVPTPPRIVLLVATLAIIGLFLADCLLLRATPSPRSCPLPPVSPPPPPDSPLPETVRELPTIPALRERLRGLNAIVTGFAHEINNPLTGIMGYLDLLDIQPDLPPPVKQKLAMIRAQAQRIHSIIQQIHHLDPSLQDVRQDIDLRNLLEKMIKVLRRRSESASVAFTMHLPDAAAVVQGHHYYLYQVFEGIVQNAIEAARASIREEAKPPRVDLTLKLTRSEAHIIIRDNGPGFQDTARAFDPFYTTKSRASKRGMGLAIAHNIVLEHHGSIRIENRTGGAEVHVSLPLSQTGQTLQTPPADGSPTVEE